MTSSDVSIVQAAAALYLGKIVAFPTETVYGIGGDAEQEVAVDAIYRLKGRPRDHPLIVHVQNKLQACWWGQINAVAHQLIQEFWPGPLTLIVPKSLFAPNFVCGIGYENKVLQQETIALRCPDHPIALELLAEFSQLGGRGIAAPSANRFGRISPTTSAHVRSEFGDSVPIVLEGGSCRLGVESTIVDTTSLNPRVLRLGGISLCALSEVLATPVPYITRKAQQVDAGTLPRVPGALPKHYSPSTPLVLIESNMLQKWVFENFSAGKIAVWSSSNPIENSLGNAVKIPSDTLFWVPMSMDPREVEQKLYATLRQLDQLGCRQMVVEHPPRLSYWAVVLDRLYRASGTSTFSLSLIY